jgi:predicted TIM-barrel fold metal-dependent hydrolase
MEKLIVVSADGHAVMPSHLWSEYVEKRYHPYLDRLAREGGLYSRMMQALVDMRTPPELLRKFDPEDRRGSDLWRGVWDLETRLKEMDREGVAAEFVFHGDHHCGDLFYSVFNGTYPPGCVDAGTRAFNRWAYDTFGPARERLLLTSPVGGCSDLDAVIAEAHWLADHGFAGVYTPGNVSFPGQPPLYDRYWDRLWTTYADLNLMLIIHGGYGAPQGVAFGDMTAAEARIAKVGGNDADLALELRNNVLKGDFFAGLQCRQALWQLMLGGVFDRHPKLKVMEVEVRGDWVPATLRLLDQTFEQNRGSLPAKKKPSEYWRTNCMAGVSFMRRSEVAIRDEIGIETMAFGRDYPHLEGSWPNTAQYLRGLFVGVPETELRAILGENFIRFLGLDRTKLAAIAARIGPSYDQIAGPGPELDPALLDHLNLRSGYLEPAEGEKRVGDMQALLKSDLGRMSPSGQLL